MNEYGSYIELDLNHTGEYYRGENVARLNTARSGIYFSLLAMGLRKIAIPRYLCETVGDFLNANGIEVLYYEISERLLPLLSEEIKTDTALLVVNYYGLLSSESLESCRCLSSRIICDNSQAFYKTPIKGAYNVYSPRKFFGVPDGCYVVTDQNLSVDHEIPKDFSSDTSLFLLKRLESGCEAAYPLRQKNEERLSQSGMRTMSLLTQKLLGSIDYKHIREKRLRNFSLSNRLYADINEFPIRDFPMETDTVPMIYPLVIQKDGIWEYLLRRKVFIGQWWDTASQRFELNKTEQLLSDHMLPIPIDQRMNDEDVKTIHRYIRQIL